MNDCIERNDVFGIDSLITGHYELLEWERAFSQLRSGIDVKAFIHPNGRDW